MMITDQLILNAKVYNSYYKRFETANVAVKEGRFLYVGRSARRRSQPGRSFRRKAGIWCQA